MNEQRRAIEWITGKEHTALARFIMRLQADCQIGALPYITGSVLDGQQKFVAANTIEQTVSELYTMPGQTRHAIRLSTASIISSL